MIGVLTPVVRSAKDEEENMSKTTTKGCSGVTVTYRSSVILSAVLKLSDILEHFCGCLLSLRQESAKRSNSFIFHKPICNRTTISKTSWIHILISSSLTFIISHELVDIQLIHAIPLTNRDRWVLKLSKECDVLALFQIEIFYSRLLLWSPCYLKWKHSESSA